MVVVVDVVVLLKLGEDSANQKCKLMLLRYMHMDPVQLNMRYNARQCKSFNLVPANVNSVQERLLELDFQLEP